MIIHPRSDHGNVVLDGMLDRNIYEKFDSSRSFIYLLGYRGFGDQRSHVGRDISQNCELA